MDNAPAHPPDLQDDFLEEFKFIKIQFLPPNTTSLLQPMVQQIRTFRHCLFCDYTTESETVSEEAVVNEIVSLAKIIGLKVDKNDIHEIVEEHNQDPTTEELVELQCVSQQEAVEVSLSEEEVIVKQQSSSAIREMLKAWETAAWYIEKHQPNKAVAMRATDLFNDNAVSQFRQILKSRQK
ncbi:hypothetical protein AVEN_49998-1 [Araneus ventricosus]|uniref:DDE-1 domain-containing protein n=1 Tax=Araneus ventricosus TaxID=182803 RepID=A0A4Y2D2V2_ARAVE|nr:hypothetical protein AVEN_49998-1 [Araneus ventricosus]